MKGDIGFVGFMLTADEWQELDAQSRAQLIAVATRRSEPRQQAVQAELARGNDVARPRRFPEGTGKHEIVESIDDELDELIEPDLLDADLLVPIDETTEVAHSIDVALFADDSVTFDHTAQYDAIEEWLAFQPVFEPVDLDEWIVLPPAQLYMPVVQYEDFADWAEL